MGLFKVRWYEGSGRVDQRVFDTLADALGFSERLKSAGIEVVITMMDLEKASLI